ARPTRICSNGPMEKQGRGGISMSHTRRLRALALKVICALGVLAGCRPAPPSLENQNPAVTVRFGMLPFGDHTFPIIGTKKGWFQEVGINLDYRPIKIEDAVPFLTNGSLDVVSCPPGVIMVAFETNPGPVSFVFGDIFQGYAIMARADAGYKSVDEFMHEG